MLLVGYQIFLIFFFAFDFYKEKIYQQKECYLTDRNNKLWKMLV